VPHAAPRCRQLALLQFGGDGAHAKALLLKVTDDGAICSARNLRLGPIPRSQSRSASPSPPHATPLRSRKRPAQRRCALLRNSSAMTVARSAALLRAITAVAALPASRILRVIFAPIVSLVTSHAIAELGRCNELPEAAGTLRPAYIPSLRNYINRPTFPFMTVLSRKGLLAIAAVIDVALQKDALPISAETLAKRHGLAPRHLESVLQSLVRDGILKGVRGPRGGYELARERQGVTANDILRAAGTVDAAEEEPSSELVVKVVFPVLSSAEQEFGQALSRITLDDMVRHAERLNGDGAGVVTKAV
jgi:Rrf2 family iron-sulfur cluster assembly transcriptional regulator